MTHTGGLQERLISAVLEQEDSAISAVLEQEDSACALIM